jgi:hypothetical protein
MILPFDLWIPFAVVVGLGLEFARRWRHHRRVWLGAFLEQARRELEHHERGVYYRPEQRANAIQQRLSRHLGKRRAFSKRTRRKIEHELRKHGLH